MNFQTILINENRLNLMDEKAREFLAEKRNKYFFEPRRTGSTRTICRSNIQKVRDSVMVELNLIKEEYPYGQ